MYLCRQYGRGPRMSLIRDLFSYKGRMGRGGLISYNLGINLSLLAWRALPLYWTQEGLEMPTYFNLLRSLYTLFILWPTTAIIVKRGHDRGRPAWYTLGLFVLLIVVSVALRLSHQPEAAVACYVVYTVYMFIDYVCLPRAGGAKRYGPSPDTIGDGRPLVLS